MRKNKIQKRNMENRLGIRLRDFCEVVNPPEYRRKDFRLGMTISEVAESVSRQPNIIFNEIRLKRLKPTVIEKRVRILSGDWTKWLSIGGSLTSEVQTNEN